MKLTSCLELFCCGECVQNGTSVCLHLSVCFRYRSFHSSPFSKFRIPQSTPSLRGRISQVANRQGNDVQVAKGPRNELASETTCKKR